MRGKAMKVREQLDERLGTLPKELREPPVAFAAASFIGPLLIVLLAAVAGQTAGALYTLAAVVFVVAVCGFLVTSYRKLRVQHAENARREAENARLRRARRPSVAPISRDTRRAS
jgi:cobalamin biosynthesis protein CobD/CbiB